jgi:hypothetical protein
VDVVAAGQAISVFNKINRKLWDAKLTYSVASRYSEEQAPCLETKDALYFADLGILARYDLATGTVRWRLNSVGISRIQADERGKLYINTTTAGPESIKYSEQINIHDKIHPVILKVDPETGGWTPLVTNACSRTNSCMPRGSPRPTPPFAWRKGRIRISI